MSLRPDGSYRCDRCGADVGNGGVALSAVISDLDPETEHLTPRRLDLCRRRPDPDNPGKTLQGCRDHVLTKKALRNYHETRIPTA